MLFLVAKIHFSDRTYKKKRHFSDRTYNKMQHFSDRTYNKSVPASKSRMKKCFFKSYLNRNFAGKSFNSDKEETPCTDWKILK